ncbi:hypothetical protein [uncultured Roseobacter sp.]|uniref:hypothetical protein n=1 Tax=uncultured Roseobacter sp. TaxID=114847 RepID=UPI0026262916|nr:hypothetical protein [uncultured Roseobacter sp.]
MSESNSTVSILLNAQPDVDGCISFEDARVVSLEMLGADSKVKFGFRTPKLITELFHANLSDELLTVLIEFGGSGTLLSIPDYVFVMDGLLLAKLRVFGYEQEDGTVNVTIRWAFAEGNILAALKIDSTYLLSHGSTNARLAFDVLECVLEPVFDLTRSQDTNGVFASKIENVDALLLDLQLKRDELEKHAALLKIYLQHQLSAERNARTGANFLQKKLESFPKYLC